MALANNEVFKLVREHADQMLDFGRDPTDDPSPLFAPVVDPLTREPKLHQLIPPPGIRLNDFPWAGNNLMHEIPFLDVLNRLTELTGEADYADAAEAVYDFYPTHCPHPKTGLFPWGEHAQWSFRSKRIIAHACHDPYVFNDHLIIHDHLHFAPGWFWARLWKHSPEAVVKFAHGLNYHIMNPETGEHNRHAPLAGVHWNEIPYLGAGKDFARHAGFFIFDTLFAYHGSGDTSLLDWARWKLKYHLDRRLPSGLIAGCARKPTEREPGQHDALALCVHDAAQVLGRETSAGAEFGAIADELFAVRAQPDCHPGRTMPETVEHAWSHAYGASGASLPNPSGLEQFWQVTKQDAYAEAILAAATWQRRVQPPPEQLPVVTWSLLRNLDIPLAAYAVSGDASHLERAAEVASWAKERFAPTGLILGCINLDFEPSGNAMWQLPATAAKRSPRPGLYFSGTGPPSLCRSLLRLAMLQEGLTDIGPDSHNR